MRTDATSVYQCMRPYAWFTLSGLNQVLDLNSINLHVSAQHKTVNERGKRTHEARVLYRERLVLSMKQVHKRKTETRCVGWDGGNGVIC